MEINDIKKLNLPLSPGCYMFKNSGGEIIYIGKAAKLKSRVASYWQKSASHTPAKQAMMKEIKSVEWTEVETEIEALLLEANLIKKHQPRYNIDLRDDKRFAYIKVSIEDEVPGVFITRRIDRSGKYFGPFTNMAAVRETLKTIRKIWPYCTERRIRDKPCFYFQINRCLGPCGGAVGVEDYKREVIEPIIKFLSGSKKQVIRDMEREAGQLEKKAEKEDILADEAKRLDFLKFQLININKVLEHANILSVAEKYAADTVELAKVLGLPRVPERIEGYDISNIFGREAVGSMVVFKSGEPDKNEYRKFKIRIDDGQANDTGMLREVLQRRLKRAHQGAPGQAEKNSGKNPKSKIQNWELPDLVIIDGGKGQLNAALKELKKAELDIPVIAVSKGAGLRSAAAPDKIFFPGEKQALVLPLASPALHIIKRVRDEAHRFAVKYHQLLRKKSLLKK